MLKKVPLILLALVGVVLVVAALQPDEVVVTRTRQIPASEHVVFAQLDDFRAWQAWSPWEKLDPAMKKQFAGTPREPGSSYAWTGNDKVGTGRMTIEKVDSPRRLVIKLEFIKPWQATNETTFTLRREGSSTNVTWTMKAHNDFVGKLFSLMLDMDSMVGPDFERGLAALERAATNAQGAGALDTGSAP